jgi:hypothetical protein
VITVKEKTTIAAISELRNKTESVLSCLKENRVVLERHQKPVAVMVNYKTFEEMDALLDFAEDYILGSLALERDKKSTPKDFIPLASW